MPSNQAQLDLISNLYDAAIDADRWTDSLDRLALQVGAKSSVLLILETLGRYRYSISKCSSHIAAQPDNVKIYERDYSRYEAEHFSRVASLPPGRIIREVEYVSDPAEFRRRPDVAFLEDRFGIYERFAVRLNDEKAWFDCITFQYDKGRTRVSAEEEATLRLFLPHLAKIANLSRTFSELKRRYQAVLGVLDRLLVGVFLVLESGEVILKNRTADNIIACNDGLVIQRRGALAASSVAANSVMQQGIRRASATADAADNGGSVMLRIDRPSGRDAYLVDISPIRDTDAEIDARYRGAMVIVIDCDQRLPINIEGLRAIYGLTAAEANVAQCLIEGKTFNEVAEIRGTSRDTVKTQAKSVYGKTNSGTRSELFQRLLSINLPIE